MTADNRSTSVVEGERPVSATSKSKKDVKVKDCNNSKSTETVNIFWQKCKLIFSLKSLRDKVKHSKKERKKNYKSNRGSVRKKKTRKGINGGAIGSGRSRSSGAFVSFSLAQSDFSTFHDLLSSGTPVDPSSTPMLDHSAARHRIAVRPPQLRRNKKKSGGDCNNNNNNTQSRQGKASSTAEGLDREDLNRNSSVIHRRSRSLSGGGGGGNDGNSKSVKSLPAALKLFSSGLLGSSSLRSRRSCDDDTRLVRQEDEEDEEAKANKVEFKSSVNANVVFRRASPQQGQQHVRQQKFLTSMEHWTLANEGLRRSIFNLAAETNEDERRDEGGGRRSGRSSSMESVCSAQVAGLVIFEQQQDQQQETKKSLEENSSSSSSSGYGDQQCEALLEVLTECGSSKRQQQQQQPKQTELFQDELENVNVKEMRKTFLLQQQQQQQLQQREVDIGRFKRPLWLLSKSCTALPTTEAEATTAGEEEVVTLRDGGSMVRALVMKFDGISCQPSSL